MKNREYQFGLGGFAENKNVLEEKTEEALEAFNFCLAEDYIAALYYEDFDDLGMMDTILLDDIIMWYIKGGGVLEENEIEAIRTGKIITNKGRMLADAVIDNRNDCLAFTFILNGNLDPRLFALCIEESEYHGLLNSSCVEIDNYFKFLKDVFECIDNDYVKFNNEDKIKLLSTIKDNLLSIGFPKKIELEHLSNAQSYQFIKDMSKHY